VAPAGTKAACRTRQIGGAIAPSHWAEEKSCPEANKIAAAILACEASRQQQKLVRAGPGRMSADRDVAGELWSYFEDFLGRLDHGSVRTE